VLIKIEMNVSGSSWKGRDSNWWSTPDTVLYSLSLLQLTKCRQKQNILLT